MVISKRVKIARFPHATGSPSTHSCLVPHPFVVIENVVEESLAYSPLLKRNMRVMAQFLPIVYRTMRWFGLKSRWHFTVTQALCSKVLVSQAFWKVRVYIYNIYIQCSWHNLSSNSLPRANQSSSERSECLRELHPWHPLAICTTQSSNLGQSITLVSIMRSFQWPPKQAGNCQQLRGCTLRPTKLRGRSAVNEHLP